MKGSTRPALERLSAIVSMARTGGFSSAGDLARTFNVCHRTIIRDIRFLQRRGHTLAYHGKSHRWFYSSAPKNDGVLEAVENLEAVNNLLIIAQEILAQPRFYFVWQGRLEDAVNAFKKPFEEKAE